MDRGISCVSELNAREQEMFFRNKKNPSNRRRLTKKMKEKA
jgi:hypothetical protein